MFENIYVKYETFYYSQLAAPVQIKLKQINNNHHKLKNEEKIFSQADKSLKGGNEVPMENVSMATKMEMFGFGWYILEILKYP